MFEYRMVDTSTRVRTATGNATPALGNLPLTVEVDSKSERITFRAIAELEQELILGMDFCRFFDVDTRLGRGTWRVHEGKWHPFDRDEAGSEETCVFAQCAGIKEIAPEEREQVLAIVERVLAEQADVPGRTHLIEHRIRLTNPETV